MAASSKTISAFLAIVLSLALASCAARAKSPAANAAAANPAAPKTAPAPGPLSTLQTQVKLPKPQPIDAAAWDTESAPPPVVETPPAPRTPQTQPRRNLPRVETVTPPPAVTSPPETTRPPMQDIVSAADSKRFQESAQNRKREVIHILEVLKTRHLSRTQLNVVGSIRSFLALSDESEKRNEMRLADVLAEKAQLLARDLQNGK
jgi:hypothetical protein